MHSWQHSVFHTSPKTNTHDDVSCCPIYCRFVHVYCRFAHWHQSDAGINPSTKIISVSAVRCRMALAVAYSSDSHQVLAVAVSGNSTTTKRPGAQLPSKVSTAAPRTIKRPPYALMDAGVSDLYTSYSTGSLTFT